MDSPKEPVPIVKPTEPRRGRRSNVLQKRLDSKSMDVVANEPTPSKRFVPTIIKRKFKPGISEIIKNANKEKLILGLNAKIVPDGDSYQIVPLKPLETALESKSAQVSEPKFTPIFDKVNPPPLIKIDFKKDIQKQITPRRYKIQFISNKNDTANEIMLESSSKETPQILVHKTADIDTIKNELTSADKPNLTKIVKIFRKPTDETETKPKTKIIIIKNSKKEGAEQDVQRSTKSSPLPKTIYLSSTEIEKRRVPVIRDFIANQSPGKVVGNILPKNRTDVKRSERVTTPHVEDVSKVIWRRGQKAKSVGLKMSDSSKMSIEEEAKKDMLSYESIVSQIFDGESSEASSSVGQSKKGAEFSDDSKKLSDRYA